MNFKPIVVSSLNDIAEPTYPFNLADVNEGRSIARFSIGLKALICSFGEKFYYHGDSSTLHFTSKEARDAVSSHRRYRVISEEDIRPMTKLAGIDFFSNSDERAIEKLVWVIKNVKCPVWADEQEDGVIIYFSDEHEFSLYCLTFSGKSG